MFLDKLIKETGIRPKPAIIIALAHIVIIATRPLWGPEYPTPFSWVAERAVNLMDAGQIPYSDFDVEYAPLGFLIMIIPRMITSSFSTFEWIITIETIILDLIGLFIIWAIARRLGYSFLNASIAATICLVAVVVAMPRDDIFPAIFVLASLYALIRGYNLTAWILLAISIMLKFYPAVVVPIYAVHYLVGRQYRSLLKGITAFIITIAVIVIPVLFISVDGFFKTFTYHADRGLEIGSTYASYLLMGEKLGICSPETCTIVNEYNSFNLDSSIADTLATLSFFVMVTCLFAVYLLFARKQYNTKCTGENDGNGNIINYAMLAVLFSMVTSKVLQPQYFLWLFLLLPLISGRWRNVTIGLFFLAALPISIHLIAVENLLELLPPNTTVTILLVWRNTLLIGLVLFFLIFDFKYTPGHKHKPPPENMTLTAVFQERLTSKDSLLMDFRSLHGMVK